MIVKVKTISQQLVTHLWLHESGDMTIRKFSNIVFCCMNKTTITNS